MCFSRKVSHFYSEFSFLRVSSVLRVLLFSSPTFNLLPKEIAMVIHTRETNSSIQFSRFDKFLFRANTRESSAAKHTFNVDPHFRGRAEIHWSVIKFMSSPISHLFRLPIYLSICLSITTESTLTRERERKSFSPSGDPGLGGINLLSDATCSSGT